MSNIWVPTINCVIVQAQKKRLVDQLASEPKYNYILGVTTGVVAPVIVLLMF